MVAAAPAVITNYVKLYECKRISIVTLQDIQQQ